MAGKTKIATFLLLTFAPLLALIVIGFLLTGDMKWIFFWVLLVPLFLLSLLVYIRAHFSRISQRNQKLFEIQTHLTEAESKQYKKLISFSLKDWVIVCLAELLLIAPFLLFFQPLPAYLAGMLPGMATALVVFPYLWRWQKKVSRFLLSTEYAKSEGWNKL